MNVFMIPEMIQKVVNFFPEWVAGFTRNQWQVYSGMGGSFEPESASWLGIGVYFDVNV